MSSDPSSSSTTSDNKMKNGIDIRQALEILAARTPHQHGGHDNGVDNDQSNSNSNSNDGHGLNHDHGCCCGGGDSGNMPESSQEILRTMGQTIDLLAPDSSSSGPGPAATRTGGPSSATKSNEGIGKRAEQKPQPQNDEEGGDLKSSSNNTKDSIDNVKEKEKNQKEQIKEHLATMSVVDLLQTVLSSQEERVKTYRTYEQALEQVLVSGNLTNYPPACATATASFAVLSDTIRAVQQELENRAAATNTADADAAPTTTTTTAIQNQKKQRKEEAQNIAKLQSLEREKLQLTAACHLERIRERNQREELKSSSSSSSNESEGRILSLLQEGITNLQKKVRSCTEQINEVLEEIRCALVEEMEGENE